MSCREEVRNRENINGGGREGEKGLEGGGRGGERRGRRTARRAVAAAPSYFRAWGKCPASLTVGIVLAPSPQLCSGDGEGGKWERAVAVRFA